MDIVVTHSEKADPLFDTKIESITRGVTSDCKNLLQKISKRNALTILDYIISMQRD
jgi:hypothetical protein